MNLNKLLKHLDEKAETFSNDNDTGFEVTVSFLDTTFEKTFEFDDEQDAIEFSEFATEWDGVYRADVTETYYEE